MSQRMVRHGAQCRAGSTRSIDVQRKRRGSPCIFCNDDRTCQLYINHTRNHNYRHEHSPIQSRRVTIAYEDDGSPLKYTKSTDSAFPECLNEFGLRHASIPPAARGTLPATISPREINSSKGTIMICSSPTIRHTRGEDRRA
jgi:hypothetical protein